MSEKKDTKQSDWEKTCFLCHGDRWYWKQPLSLNFIPAGNYGRLGNEIKTPCPRCNPEGKGEIFFERDNETFFKEFFNAMKRRIKEKQEKHRNEWQEISIEQLKERLLFIFSKHLERKNSDLEDISLVDLANQAMLLWVRKSLVID